MKKVFRIFLITLGLMLLLLITLPVLFKSRIEQAVKTQINQTIHARVDWAKFGLTFFRGFPDMSVSLHQLSVVGLPPFDGDTLAGLERFELRVNPFSALSKEIQVKSIRLERPTLQGIVLEDGSANWDISMENEAEEGSDDIEETGSSFSMALTRLTIADGRLLYQDQSTGTNAELEDLNLELSGDFNADLSQLILGLDVGELSAAYGGISYLKNAALQLEVEAEANLLENRYTLQKNEIRLNDLILGLEGQVTLLEEEAMDMDLKIFSKKTEFRTLLSLIPAVYKKDFQELNTRGLLQLDGHIFGVMQDSLMPDAKMKLQVSDGYFSYPDLPKDVSDVQIQVELDYKGRNMDASTVNVQQFHFLLGGNPFDVKLMVDHPVSDMHVAGEARGSIEFASLKDVIPLDDVLFEGRLESDLSWDTRMSFIENEAYDQVELDGSLLLEQVHVASAELPVPVELSKMHMEFTPRIVKLKTLDLKLGSSDLQLDGDLRNFIPYLFDGQTVYATLNMTSSILDANELMPELQDDASAGNRVEADSILAAPPDSLAQPARIRIPENLDFAMNLQMDKVIYRDTEVERVLGNMKVREGVAYLDQLSMRVIEGEASGSGQVDTRGDYTEVEMQVKLQGVDIRSAYEQFVSVERLAPMAKYCRGTAHMDVQFQSSLDATFNPLYESLNASGTMFTKGLQIHDLNKFMKLTEMLKDDKFTEIAPDEVEVSFKVRAGRIHFSPFDMAFESSSMTMSGSHGIDMSLDYLLDMNIAKRDLGKGANDLMNGMALLAGGAGINIPQSDYVKVKAKIRGTFNEPKVSTDLSANLKSSGENVIEAVEERVLEEVEKVEEQVREEARDQAEQLISEAEAEAERLLEEARKAGEALVKEAEKQGDKLIEEAGDNAFKQIAAKRAAQELKRQAEKQSANLITEAEEQADELIKQARAEAEKL